MQRLRRTRGSQLLRDLVAETAVRPEKLIWPLFVRWGENVKEEIPSMPGVYRYTINRLGEAADAALEAGVGGILLFGIPERKDEAGSGAADEEGVVPRAIRALRALFAERGKSALLIADICLCEYKIGRAHV